MVVAADMQLSDRVFNSVRVSSVTTKGPPNFRRHSLHSVQVTVV